MLRDSATSAKSAITGHFDLNLVIVQTLQCPSGTFFISIFKEARASGYEKQDEMTAKCDLRLYSFFIGTVVLASSTNHAYLHGSDSFTKTPMRGKMGITDTKCLVGSLRTTKLAPECLYVYTMCNHIDFNPNARTWALYSFFLKSWSFSLLASKVAFSESRILLARTLRDC